MKIITSIEELSEIRSKEQGSVALVPTMGALHTGHLQLIKDARRSVGECGCVIVSIYVNPTQFNNEADLIKYPKTLEQDIKSCQTAGVDIIFTPSSLYFKDSSITVSETSIARHLCGKTRKGHFDGVCTVVLKLYHLTQPHLMVFGEKDFQQVAVIQRLVRDLFLPVKLYISDTVREPSGLAMSSRNQRLCPATFEEASAIYKTLQMMKSMIQDSTLSSSDLERQFKQGISHCRATTSLDYISLVDAESLEEVKEPLKGNAILAVAVFFDSIRLIDHISIDFS